MFKNYLKIAIRNLLRHKTLSFINIAGLAIGIASCIMILLYVQDELSFDRHYEKADRIYRVGHKGILSGTEINGVVTPTMLAETLVRDYPEVTQAVRMEHTANMLVRYEDKVFNENRFMWVDSTFFDIFNLRVLYGDPKTALAEHHTVVLSEKTALKYFDSCREAMGKILTYEDGTPYKVSAIVENSPPNSHFHYDLLCPLSSWDWSWRQSWLSNFMYTYIVLQKDYPPEQFEAKLQDLIRKHFAPHILEDFELSFDEWLSTGDRFEYFIQPLTDIHLHSHYEQELEPNSDVVYIYIFSIIALFIMLIACINFMNLSTARSANRGKEVGVRKVLGSAKQQLIRQFLAESILLSFIALIFAVILVELLLPVFNNLAGKELGLSYFDNWFMLPALIGLAIFVGVFAGSYPAFFLASFRPVVVLKGSLGSGLKSSKLRSLLVVFQFSISIFLFISTFIIYDQLQYIQSKELGFDKEHVAVIKRGWAIGQNPDGSHKPAHINVVNAFKNELLQNPGVISAAGSGGIPGEEFQDGVYQALGASAGEQCPLMQIGTDYDFAETLKLEIAAGRFFSPDFAADTMAVVLNEAAVKAFGFTDPVGRQITWPGGEVRLNVIGVLKDFHYESLHQKIRPLLIYLRQWSRTYILVRIQADRVPETLAHLEKTWNDFIPYKPFDFFFLDSRFEALYRAEQRTGRIFAVFSLLAVCIACLGLFGLAAFTAEQRTNEIGIRKVLGASISGIVLLLSKEFTKWVLLANLIAWPIAWLAMRNWLQSFAYRISINWWAFALAALLALAIAILTVGYQAFKAATANPVDALKYE